MAVEDDEELGDGEAEKVAVDAEFDVVEVDVVVVVGTEVEVEVVVGVDVEEVVEAIEEVAAAGVLRLKRLALRRFSRSRAFCMTVSSCRSCLVSTLLILVIVKACCLARCSASAVMLIM